MNCSRYGRWTVLKENRSGGVLFWRVRCDCGVERWARSGNIKSGASASCGCAQRELAAKQATARNTTHGLSHTAEFKVWQGMLQRCRSDPRYTARGITVCKRWLSFVNFLADMGTRPAGMTIERKNNNKGYSKGNCVWAPTAIQNRNKGDTIKVQIGRRRKSLKEWAREHGLPYATVYARLRRGWSAKQALTMPVDLRFSHPQR